MNQLNFAEKIVAARFDVVIYLASTENNIPTYFYLASNGTNFRKLKQQILENKVNLQDWLVLESGYGEPTFEVRERMLKKYGCKTESKIVIKTGA